MARDLLKASEMGDLLRLEVACGDIYDYGTHYIDMFGCCNQDETVNRYCFSSQMGDGTDRLPSGESSLWGHGRESSHCALGV